MNKLIDFSKNWILPLAIAVFIALLVRQFVVFKIKVPTGSMIPTINVQDQIFTLRVHNLNKLKRGDIIVFYSDELKKTLVKRLIGLPGEKVELKDGGKLYINGVKHDEQYVVYKDEVDMSFNIPEGHYLFLGDNRPGSGDAREWKNPYIPGNKIMGKAILRIWPINRIGLVK